MVVLFTSSTCKLENNLCGNIADSGVKMHIPVAIVLSRHFVGAGAQQAVTDTIAYRSGRFSEPPTQYIENSIHLAASQARSVLYRAFKLAQLYQSSYFISYDTHGA